MQRQPDIELLEELLAALFDLWKFGYNYGGIETDITGAIVEHATEHELKSVEAWLRQEIKIGKETGRKSERSERCKIDLQF